MQLDGTPFPKVSSAPEAWDAISDGAKWQIIAFVGFLEYVSVLNLSEGEYPVIFILRVNNLCCSFINAGEHLFSIFFV